MAVMQTDAAQIVDEAVKLRNSAKQQGTKDLQKTRLCVYNLQGKCGLGSACAFAHSSSEVRSAPDLKKTQLCAKFAEGKCTDENCSFAHGEEELRTPPNFKRKLCKWNAKGLCRNGAKCGFAHDAKELRANAGAPLEPLVPKAPLRAPPGLEDELASTIATSSASPTDFASNAMFAPQMPEEALFRMAAGRGAAPLQDQVTMMTSAIGALQAKLAQLEGMMVQTQVQQLQQDIQQLSGQCWALEAGLSMTEQAAPAMNPTPLKSRLNTKAAPFMPCAFVGDSVSDDSTSVGSD
jgi:hypothetical protein